jgi:hypothetical protein
MSCSKCRRFPRLALYSIAGESAWHSYMFLHLKIGFSQFRMVLIPHQVELLVDTLFSQHLHVAKCLKLIKLLQGDVSKLEINKTKWTKNHIVKFQGFLLCVLKAYLRS